MPGMRLLEMRLATLAAVTAATLSAAAQAQDVKPLLDARLRWENVEQGGLSRDADAVTFRLRAGTEILVRDWSMVAEAEVTTAFGRYDSGVNGKSVYPIVADPESIELNRLQVQYRGLPKTSITVGRQRINIEDQRFVGAADWRQNEQTFDAIRIEHGDAKGVQANLVYSWSVRTIWGNEGHGARPQAIAGNNVFVTISHPTVFGTLSGFAFLVDQDEAGVQGFRLSSQTYGVRLAGSRAFRAARLSYAVSHAVQSDHHQNPNNYRARYWLAEVSAEAGKARLGFGFEQLGADGGQPLTSFQTPLATLHKFQGWADKFLVTPSDGIRDWSVSGGYGTKNAAGLDAISAKLAFHRFESTRLELHYGNEWDAMLSAKKGRWTATAKLAAYDVDNFATDTRKMWLQLDWSL